MQGLVLEGGGVRGAYQIGAIKALFENGYKFDSVVGTSIGAINGALIAQGDFNMLYDEWTKMSYSKILDLDDLKLARLLSTHVDLNIVKYITGKVANTLRNGGLDTNKMRKLFTNYVDEDKIRKSKIDFGLVTYNLTDLKKVELFISDIPEGELIDYLLASSRLPIFKAEVLKDKKYIDGGIYNNCPINMLDKKDFDKIVVIRTNASNRIKVREKMHNKNIDFLVIRPYEALPNIVQFDNKVINKLIKLGYYDALKVINGYDGNKSYVYSNDEDFFAKMLFKFEDKKIIEIGNILFKDANEYEAKKLLFERILPFFSQKLKIKNDTSYKNTVYAILEYVMEEEKLEHFKIYKFEELLNDIKSNIRVAGKSGLKLAIYKFVKEL